MPLYYEVTFVEPFPEEYGGWRCPHAAIRAFPTSKQSEICGVLALLGENYAPPYSAPLFEGEEPSPSSRPAREKRKLLVSGEEGVFLELIYVVNHKAREVTICCARGTERQR